MKRLLAAMLLIASTAFADGPNPPVLSPEEQKLADEATKLNADAIQLHRQGKYAESVTMLRQALEIRQKLYPETRFPDGHHHLATSLNNLGYVLQSTGQADKALPLYQQSLAMHRRLYPVTAFPDGHPNLANCLNNMGLLFKAMGQAPKALPFYQQGLEMRRTLYPANKFPDGHPQLAQSLNNMGYVAQVMGQFETAVSYHQQSLGMREKLFPATKFPDGHPDLVQSLTNFGAALQTMGQTEKALPYYQRVLVMSRKLYPATKYPDGHPDLARSFNNMGSVRKAMGQTEKALPFYLQGLEMCRNLYPVARYPNGHPDLAISFNNMGGVLKALGRAEEALSNYQQSLEMYRKLYPATKFTDGHPELANALNNMGSVLTSMGQAERALLYYQQSLEMRQKLFSNLKFPNGHPDLARSLNSVGFVLMAMDQTDKAALFFQQSLEMYQRLAPAPRHPNGHPELAHCLNNLGGAFHLMGQAEKALPYYQQALEMMRGLYPASAYPDGHPAIASCLNNVGGALQSMGQLEQALPYLEQSLAMMQRRFSKSMYPDGHPDLAQCFRNLSLVLAATGQAGKGHSICRQALTMQQQLLRRELSPASEEAAFDKVASQPNIRDTYLTLARISNISADECHSMIWPSRSMVTRLLDQRRANARVINTLADDTLENLRSNRRRIEQLLLDTRINADERDKLLTALADERDRLERVLYATMPELKRPQEFDRLGPADLARALPPGAVFIDLIQYSNFEFVDKKLTRTPRYAAFVLADRQPIQRIELGDAKAIDASVRQWRWAISTRATGPEAARLAEIVWSPLSKAIPAGTKTLYFALDGDLARLPWAALPTEPDRVLLEDYAIAQVPHGTFLLEQLRKSSSVPLKSANGPLLAIGGVDYGTDTWPALPGTIIETNAISTIAPGERENLSGNDATAAKVTESLRKARFAHIATHGQFKADELTAERKRAAAWLEAGQPGQEGRKIAAKNPLGYVGLVLSRSNTMSGLSIADLPLSDLELVTLSACETGLGELTGGEGVQGLQRAFHLAGCPNVVASLWKVNDAATAALMAKFYHELWVRKKPPIDALREAQLHLYRNPDAIPSLAGERGAPKLKEALAAAPATAQGAKRADTKLWAAFVLSGVGK